MASNADQHVVPVVAVRGPLEEISRWVWPMANYECVSFTVRRLWPGKGNTHMAIGKLLPQGVSILLVGVALREALFFGRRCCHHCCLEPLGETLREALAPFGGSRCRHRRLGEALLKKDKGPCEGFHREPLGSLAHGTHLWDPEVYTQDTGGSERTCLLANGSWLESDRRKQQSTCQMLLLNRMPKTITQE